MKAQEKVLIWKVAIKTIWDGYGADNVKRDIGDFFRVVLWHEKAETVRGEVKVTGTTRFDIQRDTDVKAVVVQVAVEADDEEGICIEQGV